MALLGKPKMVQEETTEIQVIPIPSRTYTDEEYEGALERVQTAELEREIMTLALTRIQEAESEGKVSPGAKDRLVHRYESELARVDQEMSAYKRIVDLYQLETSRERLLKEFSEQIKDLNGRISQLVPPAPQALARSRRW